MEPSDERFLLAAETVLVALRIAHKEAGQARENAIEARTGPDYARWLISGRVLDLSGALIHLLRAGHHAAVYPVARAVHEAQRYFDAFVADDAFAEEWLAHTKGHWEKSWPQRTADAKPTAFEAHLKNLSDARSDWERALGDWFETLRPWSNRSGDQISVTFTHEIVDGLHGRRANRAQGSAAESRSRRPRLRAPAAAPDFASRHPCSRAFRGPAAGPPRQV